MKRVRFNLSDAAYCFSGGYPHRKIARREHGMPTEAGRRRSTFYKLNRHIFNPSKRFYPRLITRAFHPLIVPAYPPKKGCAQQRLRLP